MKMNQVITDVTVAIKIISKACNCSERTVWRARESGKLVLESNESVISYISAWRCKQKIELDALPFPNFGMLNVFALRQGNYNRDNLEGTADNQDYHLHVSYDLDMPYYHWEWDDTLLYSVLIGLYRQGEKDNALRDYNVGDNSYKCITTSISDVLRQLRLSSSAPNTKYVRDFLRKIEHINGSDFFMRCTKPATGDDTIWTSRLLRYDYVDGSEDVFRFTSPPLGIAANYFGWDLHIPFKMIDVKGLRNTLSTVLNRAYIAYRVLLGLHSKNKMFPCVSFDSIMDSIGRKHYNHNTVCDYFTFLCDNGYLGNFTVHADSISFAGLPENASAKKKRVSRMKHQKRSKR